MLRKQEVGGARAVASTRPRLPVVGRTWGRCRRGGIVGDPPLDSATGWLRLHREELFRIRSHSGIVNARMNSTHNILHHVHDTLHTVMLANHSETQDLRPPMRPLSSGFNYLRQGGYVFASVSLCVCLCVCVGVCHQDYAKSY